MTDDDYVRFCNHAYDLQRGAESLFAKMSTEAVLQLDGLVRRELAAAPTADPGAAYDFLAAALTEHAKARLEPPAVVVPERKGGDIVPF